ncbi:MULTISPECIES: exodeoxyribonuclease VII small subunit [Nosocomiicoccus]|uniref:Exodeoxyribonuclease 7 small subunit n=1 Tax=Nosocomiicoccus massiliensis TaxID=1232430 RepID=A0AAF0YMJ9_9STAP|nr:MULTISPECIES: exodeoxyribonuclease VII small subunit [Nosocomiicoccus]MDK6862649.1 exodeoxyribonuclease VII small subunit [Nosocomiicoccus ampullae]OFL47047.1 exodeoxyribonuclease VII small subunit [Nosocomiicoccus sp. HMSC067E10]OFO55482.1 exodeoxyribonuclease VII small subunit [Nosocomiicoccus sp. HMSC059G07]OFS64205.1 exodeoxyribonuclease VII small subunit [Nosocomiicoccus sp. HMSC09A07]WOS96494.1 exodeoxyribonuclease VII small subunit [Nosocomiicoccus massiliensis]
MSESVKETQSFEEKMKTLESIIEQLDREDVQLEESLDLYKKGIELSKQCDEILKNAQLEVEALEGNTDD